MTGNYTNLVKVFDSYFGDYVDLVTTNPDLLASLDGDCMTYKDFDYNHKTANCKIRKCKIRHGFGTNQRPRWHVR